MDMVQWRHDAGPAADRQPCAPPLSTLVSHIDHIVGDILDLVTPPWWQPIISSGNEASNSGTLVLTNQRISASNS